MQYLEDEGEADVEESDIIVRSNRPERDRGDGFELLDTGNSGLFDKL